MHKVDYIKALLMAQKSLPKRSSAFVMDAAIVYWHSRIPLETAQGYMNALVKSLHAKNTGAHQR